MVVQPKLPYPVIDSDPKFSRVIRYFRPVDVAGAAGIAAFGPAFLYCMERFQPSNNAGPRLVKAMKHAGGLGLVAGFMFAYAQTSMRFWGWKENTREIKKYRVEYQQALSSGNSMEGDSSLPEHIQIVSAQYSTHAAINNSFIPWFNFANHPFHSQSTSVTADVENKQ